MSLVKISALPISTGVVLTTDYIPMVHNAVTEKVTPQILLNAAQMTNAIAVVGTSTVAQSVSAATLKAAVLQWSSPLTELTPTIASVGSSTTPQSIAAATLKTAVIQWSRYQPKRDAPSIYTLTLADMGYYISLTGTSSLYHGVVIPANSSVAFPVGTSFTVVNNGATELNINITTDTLKTVGTSVVGNRKLAINGVAYILKVSDTVWVVSGNGLVSTFKTISSAYTVAYDDIGTTIIHPSSDTTARIWTIPANSSIAIPIGTVINIVNDTSAGALTIAITTDTLMWSPTGGTGSRTLAANGIATITKITAVKWIISGFGLT